ncbi:GGDEF domain-containing protein [Pontibacterium sp. N1Y112]|uniref:diguanylate cyclase n=1 Tax=Pontibacterium sinense TaxID=2781979 RepID=A0A8J7JYW7_9GAMM|nr:GGDEF domain-containing protein [Pontibacterium sinense]MBE9398058.1 GGDEF domain-containing protein [Pontibacterium sinense]
MESFRWNKSFLTGIEEVDQQHHRLVDIINQFGDLLAERSEVTTVMMESLLQELTEYTHYHFSEEEQFMEESGIDPRHLKPHKEAHKHFIEEVLHMRDELRENGLESGEPVLKFLTHWLAYHILGTDMSMSRQVDAIKAGTSGADAFEREERDRATSTEPLLHALNGLFQQVSKRNRQLTELNRTLEERVDARTHDLAEANARLEAIAMTDVLTGLPNRRHALIAFEQEWLRADQQFSALSCMMIDADGFKQINDTYGHDAGDVVLKELANTLKDSVRSDDIVARLGGDEFLIICPDTGLEDGLMVAENVRAQVNAMRVSAGEGEWHGSISVGVSARTQAMEGPEMLIKSADLGVYQAKEDGRNCVRTRDNQIV